MPETSASCALTGTLSAMSSFASKNTVSENSSSGIPGTAFGLPASLPKPLHVLGLASTCA